MTSVAICQTRIRTTDPEYVADRSATTHNIASREKRLFWFRVGCEGGGLGWLTQPELTTVTTPTKILMIRF